MCTRIVVPSTGRFIFCPYAFRQSVAVNAFRKFKVGCLVPNAICDIYLFIVPSVFSVLRIETNENKICISVFNFSFINTVAVFIGHIYPTVCSCITEEVNCKTSVVCSPVCIRLKVNYEVNFYVFGADSFITFCTTNYKVIRALLIISNFNFVFLSCFAGNVRCYFSLATNVTVVIVVIICVNAFANSCTTKSTFMTVFCAFASQVFSYECVTTSMKLIVCLIVIGCVCEFIAFVVVSIEFTVVFFTNRAVCLCLTCCNGIAFCTCRVTLCRDGFSGNNYFATIRTLKSIFITILCTCSRSAGDCFLVRM